MENTLTEKDAEVTVAAFARWLRLSRQGDRFVYYRGRLAVDREEVIFMPSLSQYVHVFYQPMHELGLMAYHAYLQGDVVLGQKKLPDDRGYEYIAFKRKHQRRH